MASRRALIVADGRVQEIADADALHVGGLEITRSHNSGTGGVITNTDAGASAFTFLDFREDAVDKLFRIAYVNSGWTPSGIVQPNSALLFTPAGATSGIIVATSGVAAPIRFFTNDVERMNLGGAGLLNMLTHVDLAANELRFNESGVRSWVAKVNAGNLAVTSGDGNGTLTFNGSTVWHAGNDGAGSGLDADLLDGISSAAFGQLTASQTWSGTNQFNAVLNAYGGSKISVQEATDGTSARGLFMWDEGDPNWGIYMSTSGALKALNDGTATTSIDGRTAHHIRFRVNNDSLSGFIWENSVQSCLASLTADTGNLHVKGGITAGNSTGNTVWHAGNDGAGSGLDADLLDGQQGAYYLPASSYTAADVLAKLLTVDGAGSGLDADTLDGLDSSAFVSTTGVATLTNKTIALGSNTISGTLAQFNAALTDADFATGGGTATGTNTGDQTSIVGISGTKAQFNTACSDGDFLFVGDTDELLASATLSGAAYTYDTSDTTIIGFRVVVDQAYGPVQNLSFRYRVSGTTQTSAVYDYAGTGVTQAGGIANSYAAAVNRIEIGLQQVSTSTYGWTGELTVGGINRSCRPTVSYYGGYMGTGTLMCNIQGSGTYDSTITADGFSLVWSGGGSFSGGRVRVYAIR